MKANLNLNLLITHELKNVKIGDEFFIKDSSLLSKDGLVYELRKRGTGNQVTYHHFRDMKISYCNEISLNL